jgi:hypothetical protein
MNIFPYLNEIRLMQQDSFFSFLGRQSSSNHVTNSLDHVTNPSDHVTHVICTTIIKFDLDLFEELVEGGILWAEGTAVEVDSSLVQKKSEFVISTFLTVHSYRSHANFRSDLSTILPYAFSFQAIDIFRPLRQTVFGLCFFFLTERNRMQDE